MTTKEHILEEIKRTAKINGGVPLGVNTFFAETGIKKSDWYARYWVRWSEAVVEAGFEPNRKSEAFDEKYLTTKLIGLVRELGKFPGTGEIRMKRRKDSSFPSLEAFLNRFSSKRSMVSKVMEYCQGRKSFEDVIPLCNKSFPNENIHDSKVVQSDEIVGFVYLTKFGRSYKIGKTNSAGRREYELAIQLPEKTATVHVIKTDDPAGIEAYWHRRFAAKRKNGEWFDLSAADVSAFKRRKFM